MTDPFEQEPSEIKPDASDYVLYLLFMHQHLDPALVDAKWLRDYEPFAAIIKHRAEFQGKNIYLFDKMTGFKLADIFARIEKTLPTAEMFDKYVGALKANYYFRNVWEFMSEWEKKWKESMDAKAVIAGMTEFVDRMREKETPTETVHIPKEYAHNYSDELEKRRGMSEPEMKTGYAKLDEEMWGLGRGEVISVGASSGIGKSVFAMNITVNLLKQGKKVLFFSTEMSAFEQWNRVNIIKTGISAYKFRRAEFSGDEWVTIQDAVEWLQDQNNFIVDAAASPTIEHIQSVVSRYRPDVVIIDYLQRCTYGKAERHDLAVGEMMKKIKTLSRIYSCAIVVNSQLNRGAANAEADLQHFSDSAKIVHESDFAILLEEDKPIAGIQSNTIFAKIAKGRHSQRGKMSLYFDRSLLTMRPIDTEV